MVPWTLRAGERALFTLPRLAVRRQNVNHLIHHRGQLSVYLRLVDVPLPPIYVQLFRPSARAGRLR